MRLLEVENKKVLYHGSNSKISKFSLDYLSSGTGHDEHGIGIYLTNNPVVAGSYGVHLHQVTLKWDSIRMAPESGKPSEASVRSLMRQSPEIDDVLTDWDEDPVRAFEYAFKTMYNHYDTWNEVLDNVWADFYRNSPKQFLINVNKIMKINAREVKFQNGDEFLILYNPNLITDLTTVDKPK